MTTKSLTGWMLHKQWSGDTSARISFFTRELGLIHCFYKGGRTPKKQAMMQAFTPLWLSLDERYDRYYVRTLESSAPMLPLEHHALFSALYVNELLYYVLQPGIIDESLFDAYLDTMNGLAQTKEQHDIESLLRRFEWMLLKACGFAFSWTQEAKTGMPIMLQAQYQFVAGEGFLRVHQGISGECLLALAADNLQEALYRYQAKIIMRQAITHLLGGRPIKARDLYKT
jgi:DNA repair protein RecO (recombination protein O)